MPRQTWFSQMQISPVRWFQFVSDFANRLIWYSVSVVLTHRTNLWGRKKEIATTIIAIAVIIKKLTPLIYVKNRIFLNGLINMYLIT